MQKHCLKGQGYNPSDEGSQNVYLWCMGGQFLICVGTIFLLHISLYRSFHTVEPDGVSVESNNLFGSKFMITKLATGGTTAVVVMVLKQFGLADTAKVGPLLTSLGYVLGTIIGLMKHSGLSGYINDRLLFMRLFWSRIGGRNNSIQPIQLVQRN